MSVIVLRGDARRLPLPDASVDLIVTSPPYWIQRDYRDGGESMPGQLGSEPTWQEWLANLVDCTAEWARVLKPAGSMFINLGDKFAAGHGGSSTEGSGVTIRKRSSFAANPRERPDLPDPPASWSTRDVTGRNVVPGFRPKSLMGLPWRYALACTDQLGLILRRDIVWSKPNGLPESVTDRCRSSHEYLFHLVKQPRYYAAVDEIREPHSDHFRRYAPTGMGGSERDLSRNDRNGLSAPMAANPLGKLPGSVWKIDPDDTVWDIPSQPLVVPPHLGVDHFACVDTETEILTPRGWLRHDQLTEGDPVAGYDLDTNTARWTACTAVNRYDYDGDMIAVESRDLSMRLTPNHRTIVQRMHTRSHKRSPVSVVRADELTRYHFIPRSAAWRSAGDFHVGERLAAVMGWVAAEGWYQRTGVWLSQSLNVNPQHVAEIDRLIPAPARRLERKRTRQSGSWTEVTWKLGAGDKLVQIHMPDKLLPWWFVTATESERRAVLNAFIDGDGHRRPDGRIGIFQKRRHNLDVLQAIAVTLGYKTTIREGTGRFVLYLTEGGRSVTLRGTAGVGSKVRREHYTGTVWCPTTGTGTFIARRNGSVFVTGNSYPMELPRRCVLGWSPPGICTSCGEGRRPVVDSLRTGSEQKAIKRLAAANGAITGGTRRSTLSDVKGAPSATITGYACACTPHTDHPGTGESSGERYGNVLMDGRRPPNFGAESGTHANLSARPRTGPWREYHFDGWTPPPTRPAIVLDPFMGTGTTLLAAAALGRIGIGVDLSADYCRLARWRVSDPGERAKAMQVPKPPPIPDGMEALF